jgi:hypothetical protein
MATRFRALSVPLGTPTGDRRRLAPGVVEAAPTPMPLRWTREDHGGHTGAVTIGSITGLQADGNDIWAEGHLFDDVDPVTLPRLTQDVAEARKLIEEGVVGLSIDPDDYEVQLVRAGTYEAVAAEDLIDPLVPVEELVTNARIRAATLVPIPAFVETNHTITLQPNEAVLPPDELDDCGCPGDPEMLPALVASVSGDTGLPVGDREAAWDGPGAASRIFDAYSDDAGNVDKARAGKAFLWVDGGGSRRGDYKLGFADLTDGRLEISPRGVAATAGGRGVDAADIPAEAKDAVKSRICALYSKIQNEYEDWPECPFDSPDAASTAAQEYAALTASEGPAYPAAAFTAPVEITGLTPITYDWDGGIVYGHVAPWGVCHQGIADSCVLAPHDRGGEYREFHTHRVETDQGTVYAGRITAGGRHPEIGDEVTAHHVRQHHDQLTTVAYVRAREDDFGIFVCGPIVPGLDEETRHVLSRRKVSADWRETIDGLSMVEVLALGSGPRAHSEPGFPVRTAFAGGRQVALVASLSPEPEAVQEVPERPFHGFELAEAFRQAYHAIKDEEAKAVQAERLRGELSEVLAEDAERVRSELTQVMGG